MSLNLFRKEKIDYKYSEDRIIKELDLYIKSTYGQHYSSNNFQLQNLKILTVFFCEISWYHYLSISFKL